MGWEEWQSSAGVAANLTSLAFKFAESFKSKPRPELDIVLKQHGGGDGLHFGAKISEVSNRVPAIRVHVFAELEEEGVVWEIDQPVNLRAGEIDREIMFEIERPKYGTLVPECNHEPTLFGRTITVTAVSDNGGAASDSWHEKEYDPETSLERWQAMEAAKRFARGEDPDLRM